MFVDGESWGTAPQSQVVEVGTYTVSFGDVTDYTTPSDEEAVVTVDATTFVEGIYVEIPVELKLVITYTPDIVYKDDIVTVTVTADDVPIAGATVYIVDPNGDINYNLTKSLGTCTFTADPVGEWDIYAESSGYESSDTVTINVLELALITEISLSVGWNLISLPLMPYDSSIDSVLSDIIDYVEGVWSYDAATLTWSYYVPGAPSNLDEMVDGKGYWVRMAANTGLYVDGTEMPLDPFTPLPAYPVMEGWNHVGFKETYEMTVDEYLAGVSYVIVYEYIDEYNLLSGGDFMVPGRGYWVAVLEPGIIYP